jgi:hypothetical protein
MSVPKRAVLVANRVSTHLNESYHFFYYFFLANIKGVSLL